jgi:hypothetical protein
MRRVVSFVVLLVAQNVGAQTPASAEAPLPTVGLDFASVDAFWRLVDVLRTDADPSDAEWRAALSTPGYRLARIAIGDVMREDLELAIKPSHRARFDSLTRLTNDRASRLKHLARAATLRPQLTAFQDSLSRFAPVVEAVAIAARWLPPGATNAGDPPLVAFALFRGDGYSLGPGVIVDLLHASESTLTLFLAHEFHHTYVARLQPVVPVAPNDHTDRAAEFGLRAAIQALRSEGIADLIDKPYPLVSENPVRSAYVRRYNEEYAKTPATLRVLDSLLVVVANDSTQMPAVAQHARRLLWSNSHANGAYIARAIYDHFGVDSLFPAVTNPIALLRTYTAVERARHNAAPFSPTAWRVLETFERRYWRP